MDCNLRNVPTWLENITPHRPEIVQKQANLSSTISNAITQFFNNIKSWSNEWNNYTLHNKKAEVFLKINRLIHEINTDMDDFENNLRNRTEADPLSIANKISTVAHEILNGHNPEEEIDIGQFKEKSSTAIRFTLMAVRLKNSRPLFPIWENLTDAAKVICHAGVPYALPPNGCFADVDLMQYNLDKITNFPLVILTDCALTYRGTLLSRAPGQISFKIGKLILTEWLGIDRKKYPNNESARLLENEIANSQIEYMHCMEYIPSLFENKTHPDRICNSSIIEHRHFRLVQYYYQNLFALFGIPVNFPFFVGPQAEFFITSTEPKTPLTDILKTVSIFDQQRFAKSIADTLESEFKSGIICLKSLSFVIQNGQLYAADLEERFLPMTIQAAAIRLLNVQQALLTMYKKFPTFVNLLNRHFSSADKLIKLYQTTIEFLNKINKEIYNEALWLSVVAIEYDISMTFLTKKNSDERKANIRAKAAQLLIQMPKKDEINPLFTESKQNYMDNQLRDQAELERLIIEDFICDSLESRRSFDLASSVETLMKNLIHYKPSEEVNYLTKNDLFKDNGEYFTFLFWEYFINQFAQKMSNASKASLIRLTLEYFAQPGKLEYKRLLHSHLVQFNRELHVQEFYNRVEQVKLSLDTGQTQRGK